VTRSLDSAHSNPIDGLFRAAGHVLVVAEGSVLAILDLERGVVYATTPFGAESWSTLVDGRRPPHRAVGTGSERGEEEGGDAWAMIAGYFLDRRIIEPVSRG
jgi:hypothetical protein